jgi:serine/threonine-protein kinase
MTFRQVTALVAGGLVRLESTNGEPELPIADVNARYTILTTGSKDVPLLLVDGQDAPGSMRDRIQWEGLGVAYHDVTYYRRDQSSEVGAVPTLYDRSSWTVAVGAREKDAIHGDLKFAREPDAAKPAWLAERDTFRLGDDTPARSSGADLARIPEPPPTT